MTKKTAQDFAIPIIVLIIAYEWLISSIDKILTKNYISAFHKQLAQGISDITVHPYATLVKSVGLPLSNTLSILVLSSELFVAVIFILFAIRSLTGKAGKVMGIFAFIASIFAAFMSLNYAILGGDSLLADPANAFQEGISIDWMFFLIETTLAFYFFSILKQKKAND